MNKKTINVDGQDLTITIPDGWSAVEHGLVKSGDRLWYRDKNDFGELGRNGLDNQLGNGVDSFFCCIRRDSPNCCQDFGDFYINEKTEGFKFCPFCGKEIKKEC